MAEPARFGKYSKTIRELIEANEALGRIMVRMVDERDAQIAHLRKGIQDFLDGNYEHPRSYRFREGTDGKCPHCRYWYEECDSCNEAHFSKLLGETYTDDVSGASTEGDRG